ncbi:unnamed protein product [Lactuca virosa]|uniref:Rad51-like C-terminal domain-containing protein n=1 Tax=Lactuca virosa TaxID=75947 RepID=A0AAU9PGF0_9ASTR|nr:unnamed protein product [Lactuca virosa]
MKLYNKSSTTPAFNSTETNTVLDQEDDLSEDLDQDLKNQKTSFLTLWCIKRNLKWSHLLVKSYGGTGENQIKNNGPGGRKNNDPGVFLKAMAEIHQIKLFGEEPTLTETALYRARKHLYKEERLQDERERLQKEGLKGYFSICSNCLAIQGKGLKLEDIKVVLSHTSNDPSAVKIVDSVIALFRVDFTGRGELAERQVSYFLQQKLAQMLSRLTKIAEEFNVAVYMTNQGSTSTFH